ncbi:hypothetical protein Daus18300_004359 [Diaporthe australafricana]|uniref:Uncharacterized protein n=1 Tax=Diaporthe australafricana TaxID=127596 RepID=A0ABR3X9V2_9PEZI
MCGSSTQAPVTSPATSSLPSARVPVKSGGGNNLTFYNAHFDVKLDPQGITSGCGCANRIGGSASTEAAQRLQERLEDLEDRVEQLQSNYQGCNYVGRPAQQQRQ